MNLVIFCYWADRVALGSNEISSILLLSILLLREFFYYTINCVCQSRSILFIQLGIYFLGESYILNFPNTAYEDWCTLIRSAFSSNERASVFTVYSYQYLKKGGMKLIIDFLFLCDGFFYQPVLPLGMMAPTKRLLISLKPQTWKQHRRHFYKAVKR